MTKQRDDHQIVSFPRTRKVIIDTGWMGRRKQSVYGLFEVDVTEARTFLREHKTRTGESLSFTAFILACLGKAIDENKYLHAYRNWRGQLVLFDEVDITTIIEIDLEGEKFPLAHIIRAANKRTVRDIHDEIRAIQANPQRSIGPKSRQRIFSAFLSLPAVLRRIFYWPLTKSPRLIKNNIGTVVLTAIGMFGEGGGWGIPTAIHTLNVTLGGIAEKPGVVAGKIQIREYLSVTLCIDHDIVDGAPGARFAARLKELIESGYGLEH